MCEWNSSHARVFLFESLEVDCGPQLGTIVPPRAPGHGLVSSLILTMHRGGAPGVWGLGVLVAAWWCTDSPTAEQSRPKRQQCQG